MTEDLNATKLPVNRNVCCAECGDTRFVIQDGGNREDGGWSCLPICIGCGHPFDALVPLEDLRWYERYQKLVELCREVIKRRSGAFVAGYEYIGQDLRKAIDALNACVFEQTGEDTMIWM